MRVRAREIVTYVKEKLGLRIRDSKTSEAGFRERSDPTCVAVVSSLLSGKGKWSSDPRERCLKGDAAHFQRGCNACKNTGKQTSGKGNQNKSWSLSEPSSSGKGKSQENQRESIGLSKGSKSENEGANGSCRGKNVGNGTG